MSNKKIKTSHVMDEEKAELLRDADREANPCIEMPEIINEVISHETDISFLVEDDDKLCEDEIRTIDDEQRFNKFREMIADSRRNLLLFKCKHSLKQQESELRTALQTFYKENQKLIIEELKKNNIPLTDVLNPIQDYYDLKSLRYISKPHLDFLKDLLKDHEIAKWNIRYQEIHQNMSGLYQNCETCTPSTSGICPKTEAPCLLMIKKDNSIDRILRKIKLLGTNLKHRWERKKIIRGLKKKGKNE